MSYSRWAGSCIRRSRARAHADEAGRAMAGWAFERGIEQVIALVRPANTRVGAAARCICVEWVGETEKYHNLRLQEYRLRPATWWYPAVAALRPGRFWS